MIYFFQYKSTNIKFTCYAESEGEAWSKLAYAIQDNTDGWKFNLRIHLKEFYLLYDRAYLPIKNTEMKNRIKLLTHLQEGMLIKAVPRVDVAENDGQVTIKGKIVKIDHETEEVHIQTPDGVVKVIKFINFLIEVLPWIQRVLLLISTLFK